jgi:hypothetical protein
MANQYFQIPGDVLADTSDSQPVTTWRWSKKVMALSVSCLVLVAIVTVSTSTLQGTSTAESTDLMGLSRSLRSPLGGAVQYGMTNSQKLGMYGIQSSPIARLAMSAIEANQGCHKVGDVSMKAQLRTALAESDEETKEEVEKVEMLMIDKARKMAGSTAPLGYFDPLGLSVDVSVGRLLFFREAELKHGRVCMLASLGIVVAENFHPLFGGDIDVPAYIAFQQTPLQTFWPLVLLAIGTLELPAINTFNWPFPSDTWSLKEGRVPGDFDFDPLGLKPKGDNEFRELQTKELNNGRLAMIATAGMIVQELATGKKILA